MQIPISLPAHNHTRPDGIYGFDARRIARRHRPGPTA